jgi:serine/threonine protein kinase
LGKGSRLPFPGTGIDLEAPFEEKLCVKLAALNSCVDCGFEVRFKLIQFSRVTVTNSAFVMEAEEFSSNHANNNGVVTPNGLPLGCISGRENSSNTGSVEIDEVDTTAQLEEGLLQWKLVSINGKPWWRLVLVHARLNVAYEGGFGEIQACTSLPMVGGAPVFLMTVSRANVAKVGFTPCYYSFTTAPTFYSGGYGAWVQIQCADPRHIYYYYDRNNRASAEPITSVVGTIRHDDAYSYIDFQTPCGNVHGLRLEVSESQEHSGRLIAGTLSGEVRVAVKMSRVVDSKGMQYYEFPNPANIPEDAKVAIKIYGHGNNVGVPSAAAIGEIAVPTNTRDIRHIFGRENPVKETEILTLIRLAGGHPNVMNIQACLADQCNVYQVLDFMNMGEFYGQLYTKGSPIQEYIANQFGPNTKDLMKQILSGLKFLHDHGIAHFDISTENIFVHQSKAPAGGGSGLRFVLGDFGQSVIHRRVNGQFLPLRPYPFRSAPGKMLFFVPETYMVPVEQRTEYDGFKVDFWAIGMLHLIVFCRIHPFEALAIDDPRTLPTLTQWFKDVEDGKLREIKLVVSLAGQRTKVALALIAPELLRIIISLLERQPVSRGLSMVGGQLVPYRYHEEPFYIG